MAQSITIAGATYPDVPALTIPKSGGGTAQYTDVSDTTATAEDVMEGKYFYTAEGIKAEGTGAGGGSVWQSGIYQDEDGFICVSPNAGASANGITLLAGDIVMSIV